LTAPEAIKSNREKSWRVRNEWRVLLTRGSGVCLLGLLLFALAGYPQRLASAVTDLKTFWGLSSAEKYQQAFDDPVFFELMDRVRVNMPTREKVILVIFADVDTEGARGYYYYYYRGNYLLYPRLAYVVHGGAGAGQGLALQRVLQVAQDRGIGKLVVYCAWPCPEPKRFLGRSPLVTVGDSRGYLYDLPVSALQRPSHLSEPRPDRR